MWLLLGLLFYVTVAVALVSAGLIGLSVLLSPPRPGTAGLTAQHPQATTGEAVDGRVELDPVGRDVEEARRAMAQQQEQERAVPRHRAVSAGRPPETARDSPAMTFEYPPARPSGH